MEGSPEVDSPVPTRDDENPQVDINIRTVDGETYEYTVNRFEQVNTLITQLEERIEVPDGHAIRLIHSGRILNPQDTFAQHRIESGTFVHAQVSEVQSRSRSNRRNRRRGRNRNNGQVAENGDPLTGFDRLSQFGFSSNEIERIRLHFHAMNPDSRLLAAHHSGDASELASRLRESEDGWLQAQLEGGRLSAEAEAMRQGVSGGHRTELNGGMSDLVTGLFVGFAFGLLSLFFAFERATSRRRTIGVIVGVGINCGLTLMNSVLS